MNIGERVFVESFLFSGPGVIDFIADPGEWFPVQVFLDVPADDGQRLKRVAMSEIRPIEQDQPREPVPTLEMKYRARVNRKRLGYLIGDEYIIGPAKKQADHFNVYLCVRPSVPIGTYHNNSMFLEILEPYEEIVIEQPTKPIERPHRSPQMAFSEEKRPTGTKPKKNVQNERKRSKQGEQLSIFEFEVYDHELY